MWTSPDGVARKRGLVCIVVEQLSLARSWLTRIGRFCDLHAARACTSNAGFRNPVLLHFIKSGAEMHCKAKMLWSTRE